MNLKITHITDKVSLRMNLIRKKDKINKKQNRVKNGLYQLNDLSKCFVPLGGGPVVRVWDQEVCSLCGFRFESCGCSWPLEAYMVVNFRVREISRGTHKLARTPTLN